ncbi:hypothetical protein PMKS-003569 [Pichia membranifaciens]|uniref:Uncharacterized protein n=1 Tax=Pichia membranifaciens TaxID=4926 RepID=A0A1Q2YL35_9ASCO|nr:hypothetical protein PMKS-003569 [Pichia membranifaciens]
MFEVGCHQYFIFEVTRVAVDCVDQRGEAAEGATTVYRGAQHSVVPHDELECVARGGRDHKPQVPGVDGAQAVADFEKHRDHSRRHEPELLGHGQKRGHRGDPATHPALELLEHIQRVPALRQPGELQG